MKQFVTVVLAFAILSCFMLAIAEQDFSSEAYPILQQGSSGEDVKALQEQLIELGYLNGSADGIYGQNTANAVMSFQEDNGLLVNGIANIETQTALFAPVAADYILNTNSKKFHLPDCSGVASMSDKNKQEFHGTRDEAIAMGYDPCGTCKP